MCSPHHCQPLTGLSGTCVYTRHTAQAPPPGAGAGLRPVPAPHVPTAHNLAVTLRETPVPTGWDQSVGLSRGQVLHHPSHSKLEERCMQTSWPAAPCCSFPAANCFPSSEAHPQAAPSKAHIHFILVLFFHKHPLRAFYPSDATFETNSRFSPHFPRLG